VVEATKENFRELVAQGTVVVDVWGPHCAPCIAMMPAIERLAESRQDLTFIKLDSSKTRRLCIEMRIMGLPAFLLFRDGKELSRIGGNSLTIEQVTEWLDQTLKS
jgi:thioredoxin 1